MRLVSILLQLARILLDFIYPVVGLITAALEVIKPHLSRLLITTYDDFKDLREDLWEVVYPDKTPRENLNLKRSVRDSVLTLNAEKKSSKLPYPISWEGPMIRAKKKGYNAVMAKVMLDFMKSTANKGNVYIRGRSRRFLYLIGIDKESRDVFFHCMDLERGCEYTRRGRAHFKDYFKDGNRWLILGLEWTGDSVKYFACEEGENLRGKPIFSPPPEISDDVARDCLNAYIYGADEICIRLDLV
ncbi:MAG: hypothetical protein ACP5KE_07105, partial [Candidatus Methanodesulfokora sp.]